MGVHLDEQKGKGVRFPFLSVTSQYGGQRQQQLLQMTPSTSPRCFRLQLAWDYARRQSVALKTFHLASPYTLNDSHRRMLKQEVLSMDRVIPHPNVVELLEVVKVSSNEVRLVMEAAPAFQDNLMEIIAAAPTGR